MRKHLGGFVHRGGGDEVQIFGDARAVDFLELGLLDESDPDEGLEESHAEGKVFADDGIFESADELEGITPVEALGVGESGRGGVFGAFGDDELLEFAEFAAVLGELRSEIGDDGGATEAESDGDGFPGGVEDVGIDAAREGLGGFAELGVNATESLFVEEDAGSIGAVGELVAFVPRGAGVPLEEGFAVLEAGFGPPVLVFDAEFFLGGDFDGVLTAAPAAVVTAPILQDGELQGELWHGQHYGAREFTAERTIQWRRKTRDLRGVESERGDDIGYSPRSDYIPAGNAVEYSTSHFFKKTLEWVPEQSSPLEVGRLFPGRM